MCLATVYKESDDSVIFKNVSRIDAENHEGMDGRRLILNVKGAVYFLTAPFVTLWCL